MSRWSSLIDLRDMGRFLRVASPSTLVLALLMLLLPFLSVSCDAPDGFGRVTQGGTTSYTGVDLLIGGDPSVTEENLRPTSEIEDDNIGVEPAVVVGVLAMLAALLLALSRRHLYAAGAAAVGWVVMLIGLLGARGNLTDLLEAQRVTPLPDGKATGDYVAIGPGFWLMTLFIAVSVGLCLLATRVDGHAVNRTTNDEESAGTIER